MTIYIKGENNMKEKMINSIKKKAEKAHETLKMRCFDDVLIDWFLESFTLKQLIENYRKEMSEYSFEFSFCMDNEEYETCKILKEIMKDELFFNWEILETALANDSSEAIRLKVLFFNEFKTLYTERFEDYYKEYVEQKILRSKGESH